MALYTAKGFSPSKASFPKSPSELSTPDTLSVLMRPLELLNPFCPIFPLLVTNGFELTGLRVGTCFLLVFTTTSYCSSGRCCRTVTHLITGAAEERELQTPIFD